MKDIRLQKALAQAGLSSRRAAEELIRQGRVHVNGRVVTELGFRVNPEEDEIRVDSALVPAGEPKSYLLFYKPKHCVTTLSDPQGRKTVLDFVRLHEVRLFPVGRLDYDAEGLLLLTNDGDLAHRLQHPRYGVPKIYEVKVQGHPDEKALERLRSGVVLEEGATGPAEVSLLRLLPRAAWIRMVIHQGWNRQIKRMAEAVGHPVLKLKRIGYGPLKLSGLAPGESRALRDSEVKQLRRLVHLSE
jgi:23S rRNA pseudouridine2605 synthase